MRNFNAAVAALVAASLLSACSGGGTALPRSSASGSQSSNTLSKSAMSAKPRMVRFTPVMRARFASEANNKRMLMYSRSFLKSHPSFKWGPNATTAVASSNNLNYNGGPVQTAPKIDIVYWGWQGIPDASNDPADVYDYLNGFFNSIGGGAWINIDTQYYGSNGYIQNTNPQLGSVVYDTSTPPNPYQDSDVQREALAVESYLNDYSLNVNYVVVTPTGVSTPGFGSQWCAYHSDTTDGGGNTVSYTDLPYIPDVGTSCGQGSVNSPGTNDGVSIVGGHEESETQTDPQPSSGWVDSSGQEIGDKCAWQNLQDNPNAGNYATQPLWDNAIGGCAQSGP